MLLEGMSVVDLQTRCKKKMVAGEGFEPSKAEPGDLQSPPIGSNELPGSVF